MQSVIFTDEAYSELEKAIADTDFSTKWFPTTEDVEKYISKNPYDFIPFMIWLIEKADTSTLTDDQKSAKKMIQKILYEVIAFADEEEEGDST